ncbi:DUF4238 domain-containing protein [Pedococcus sp. NPDC057267]|uniref:DUF4238 domain-containing protein n=1 Tax=Pedococcus sp. NPDC057267 TaxID=3346077 RepID=UPI003645BED5
MGGDTVKETGGFPSRHARERHARALGRAFKDAMSGADADEQDALDWLGTIDPSSHVGSRHHVVPRFLLDRWAVKGQVRTYSRLDGSFSPRSVSDLAVKDFYTFLNKAKVPDSSFETLLGRIESDAAAALGRLVSPFTNGDLSPEDIIHLAHLAAFQLVRTPRRRRELELHTEWYAKTIARGVVPDAQLRRLSIEPHQNDTLRTSMTAAQHLLPYLLCRPLCLIVLDRPRLLTGDEPVIVNTGPDDGTHHPDCFLTDAQVRAREAKERRKKQRLRRDVGRAVHFRPTRSSGVGVALEIVLPVSPRAALWWGPLLDAPFVGPVQRERLDEAESARFAELANDAISSQALDWVISSLDDSAFLRRSFPALEPVMRVCDGDNAAALAVNAVPVRFRPVRLRR